MTQLHETKLRRFKLANRRGTWTTWGAPGTWGSCLIRSDGSDQVSQLAQCASVIETREVTQEVLTQQFTPPKHPWSLLVESPYQQWATFADDCRYNEALDNLHTEFPGDILRTGAVDDFGTIYVRCWKNGEQVLEFTTDGKGWPTLPEDIDDDDDDEDGDNGEIFIFNSSMYPDDWPHTFARVEEAHQKLIIDLDAYVSGLSFIDGQLSPEHGHYDVAVPSNITRITLVRFRA